MAMLTLCAPQYNISIRRMDDKVKKNRSTSNDRNIILDIFRQKKIIPMVSLQNNKEIYFLLLFP